MQKDNRMSFQHPERKPRSGDPGADPPHFCDAAPPVAPGRIAVSADRFDPRFYDSLYALPVYEGLRMNNYGYAPLTREEGEEGGGGGGELEGQGDEAYQRQLYVELLRAAPAWWHRQQKAAAAAAPAPAPASARHVLEVGCGNGGGLEYLRGAAPPGTVVHGLDCSAAALRRTKTGASASGGGGGGSGSGSGSGSSSGGGGAGGGGGGGGGGGKGAVSVALTQADAGHLPVRDGSIDLLVSVEATGCFRDPEAFLREVRRVLRPATAAAAAATAAGAGAGVAAAGAPVAVGAAAVEGGASGGEQAEGSKQQQEEGSRSKSCLLLADYRKADRGGGGGGGGGGIGAGGSESVAWLRAAAARAGLHLACARVVTDGVVRACRLDSARREALLETRVAAASLRPQLREFAAVEGDRLTSAFSFFYALSHSLL